MTLMQLIKLVLDEAYAAIPAANDAAKDALIAQELAALSAEYGALTNANRTPIDYSSPLKRFAYIYKYTVAHADYVRQVINMAPAVGALLQQSRIEVSCLGGGPGSDLLGILKYMMQRNISGNSLTCYIFDQERAWGDSWSDVARLLQAPFGLFPVFQQMDVTDPGTWQSYNKFLRSDLFTLSYFVSEVWAIQHQAQPFFDHCFANMKSGAIVLFIDNNSASFVNWFDEMVATRGFNVLVSRSSRLVFANEEEKTDLGDYYTKFGWPKRESNAAYRIVQKV